MFVFGHVSNQYVLTVVVLLSILSLSVSCLILAILSAASFLIGLLFCQRSGEYWLQMFDSFSGTIPLLFIGLFELIAVNYIYGGNK